MFSKADAIAYIKGIQSGHFARSDNEDVLTMRGSIAVKLWDEGVFGYGMEYGAILALMEAFDLTIDDMRVSTAKRKDWGL